MSSSCGTSEAASDVCSEPVVVVACQLAPEDCVTALADAPDFEADHRYRVLEARLEDERCHLRLEDLDAVGEASARERHFKRLDFVQAFECFDDSGAGAPEFILGPINFTPTPAADHLSKAVLSP